MKSENTESDISKNKNKEKKKKKNRSPESLRRRWVICITIVALLLSITMSMFSDMLLRHSNMIVAFIILIVIILIGILFDILGVAVTAVEEKPFHAMAASKVKGAKSSLALIKNASRVSNLCNDVIGDTCGIISGASAAYIVSQIDFSEVSFMDATLFSMLLSGIVAALTIGGKALGKDFSINNAKQIIKLAGRVISIFTGD